MFLFVVEFCALVEAAIFARETRQLDPAEKAALGGQGLVGAGLADTDDQQRQEADEDVGADPLVEAVINGA